MKEYQVLGKVEYENHVMRRRRVDTIIVAPTESAAIVLAQKEISDMVGGLCWDEVEWIEGPKVIDASLAEIERLELVNWNSGKPLANFGLAIARGEMESANA